MTVKMDGGCVLGRGQWVQRPWGRRKRWKAAGGWEETGQEDQRGGVDGGDLGRFRRGSRVQSEDLK